MRGARKFKSVRNLIFFMNALISFLIIAGANFLTPTDFGRAAMVFGFLMLALSTILRIMQRW